MILPTRSFHATPVSALLRNFRIRLTGGYSRPARTPVERSGSDPAARPHTDSHYAFDREYVGMFTMKPRFKHMPPDQVEAFKRVLIDPRVNG